MQSGVLCVLLRLLELTLDLCGLLYSNREPCVLLRSSCRSITSGRDSVSGGHLLMRHYLYYLTLIRFQNSAQ